MLSKQIEVTLIFETLLQRILLKESSKMTSCLTKNNNGNSRILNNSCNDLQ